MNSVRFAARLRLPLNKELLRPGTRVQAVPVLNYSKGKSKRREPEVPENIIPEKEKFITNFQKQDGEVYDTRPFKITLEANKNYFWCLCGRSNSQPLCDGTHKDAYRPTPLKPICFKVKETKEYWLCNCKHTNLRPFCDGTHKTLPQKRR